MIREFYGRELMRMDLVDQSKRGTTFFDITVGGLGQVNWAECDASPFESTRTHALLNDGSDDVLLSTTTAGLFVESGDSGFFVEPNGGLLISKARAFRVINSGRDTTACITMPRAGLAMLLPEIGEAPIGNIPAGTPGLDMLFGYARLAALNTSADRHQRSRAGDHLVELAASIIRPGREAGGNGDSQKISDARLEAIKSAIRTHMFHSGLSLERIAALQGVTPRYVQRLFEREGTNFSDYVRRQRLNWAWFLLSDSGKSDRRILSIALECGFNDVTTFTRAFRREFNMTPREAKENFARSRS